MSHLIDPQYLDMFKRYQCRFCHSWIGYSEETGKWRHL